MPRLPHRRLDEHSAHTTVPAARAAQVGIDWPVSGDETLREVGRAAVRDAHHGSIIWNQRWARPKFATAGIRVGDTITALDSWGEYRTGVVTHVGTEGGWASADGLQGDGMWRWEASGVTAWPQPVDPATV